MIHGTVKWFTVKWFSVLPRTCGWGCCSEETGRPTSRSAFVQVVGLLNTYLPLTVKVFVGKVKWFTAVRVGVPWE